MEELTPSIGTTNQRALFNIPNSIPHSIYIYSSRYIPMPEKDKEKLSEGSSEQIVTLNDSFYQEVKIKIQDEYQDLNTYISQLQQKINIMNDDQINWLGDKYRYYLGKFKKYLSQHQKLVQACNNLQNTVLQSNPVQQQIKSINFIKMISLQTDKKLAALKQLVKQSEQQKNTNQMNMHKLRQQLNSLKSQYFNKKRQQAELKDIINTQINQRKLKQIQQTMLKIRLDKKIKLQQTKKSYHNIHSLNRNTSPNQQNPSSILSFKKQLQNANIIKDSENIDKTLRQLKNINNINQKYIKTLSQTCQNFKNRQLQTKKQINNQKITQIDLQNYREKSRQQKRSQLSQDQELMTNQQIIKQLSITNRLKEEFDKKKNIQIMNMIIKSKKVKQLFKIIEQVKNEEKKNSIIQKRKINFIRSQIYKNNSSVIVRDSENNCSQLTNSQFFS